jgi:branched-chain amino acid transport system ATP-binding protein
VSLSISVTNVSHNFGGVRAVDNVSFDVPPGTIAGLIGPNGAGKTTMFNIITGMLTPTDGTVVIGSHDVTGLGIAACSRLGVARTFQTPRCFPSLTVHQNIEVMYDDPRGRLFGALFRRGSNRSHEQAALALLRRLGLAHLANCATDLLSGGELRMLEIARQLARGPKILMLDEPTAGLDRGYQEQLSSLLAEIAGQGTTILLVEHNLRFLFDNVDSVHVMSEGQLIASGDPTAIAEDEVVINAYLGRGQDASSST